MTGSFAMASAISSFTFTRGEVVDLSLTDDSSEGASPEEMSNEKTRK